MDINRQPEQVAVEQPTKPLEYNWIAQRQATEGNAASIWKFGFIAPDGAEVRVTFHEVGDIEKHQQDVQAQKDQASQSSMMGMPPSPDQSTFTPAGQPETDLTNDATFYATFFSNRHPEFFMKWDTSLNHEQSLMVWVTITHGIIDFVSKAKPANLILDDIANGKLKMVLRSVAMDVVGANPEYEIEQTQKHHYRTFFQIKKTGTVSAFGQSVQGKSTEGQTDTPQSQANSPVTAGQEQRTPQAIPPGKQPPEKESPESVKAKGQPPEPGVDKVDNDKGEDPKAFPSADDVQIKQTPKSLKGFTLEIGKDYSVAVKNKDGDAVDRYRAKGPADLLRWINDKGYAANKMTVVDAEQPSTSAVLKPEPKQKDVPEKPEKKAESQVEQFVVDGTSVKMPFVPAKKAAAMNALICAENVRCTADAVVFQFATDKDMNFKRALVELAYQRLQSF